jgi:tetratricopeptide (TPR) repeat protein
MPAYTEVRGQKVVRTQDMIIYNLIMNSKWQRPVYFALTVVSTNDKIGLDPFLELQGMALEVTPIKRSSNRFNINLKAFEENMLSENVQPSKEFQRGFMFRNLDKPDLNIEEQSQDLIQTYRALYSMVARDLAMKNERDKAKKFIDFMEKKIPIKVLPMTYSLLLDMLDLCMYLNDEDKIKYYSNYAEEEALQMLSKNPKDVENMSVLAMIYERKKEYTKAIDIYKKFLEMNPNEQNVKARIAYLESIMKTDTTKNKGVN